MEKDNKQKKIIYLIVFTILITLILLVQTRMSFVCDRSSNICTEKRVVPLLGSEKINYFKLSDIESAHVDYSRIRSSKGKTWISRLILETPQGNIQIFDKVQSYVPEYQKECSEIKQFLTSNEPKLEIKTDNIIIFEILFIIFICALSIIITK